MKMENKYWALILIGVIVVACVAGSISYNSGREKGYNEKICIDNYDGGYNDGYEVYKEYCDEYKEWKEEKIASCFNNCADNNYPDDEIANVFYITCVFKCLNPDYGIAKMDGGN